MPKIRGIKPDFWTDKNIVGLSPLARLLYLGMWNYAADCGHLEDEPIELKMRILPVDNCDVDELINELDKAGRILRTGGVICIPKLTEHQKIDKRYFTACPACKAAARASGTQRDPDEKATSQSAPHDGDTTGTRREPSVSTTEPLDDGDGDGDSDSDSDKRTRRAKRESDLDTDPHFLAFWAAYPRREDKGHARKAWLAKIVKADQPADVVVDATRRFATKSNGSDRKFIPMPATWLNGERWLDEEPTSTPDNGPQPVFRLPTPPPDIADDPAAYQQWVRDRRAEWDAKHGGRVG